MLKKQASGFWSKQPDYALAALRKLRDQVGATMFYGHDPAQWQATPRAPTPVL